MGERDDAEHIHAVVSERQKRRWNCYPEHFETYNYIADLARTTG